MIEPCGETRKSKEEKGDGEGGNRGSRKRKEGRGRKGDVCYAVYVAYQ